jgi:hypothetical protein
MSRRHFLRGTGVALSLPFLDVMLPTFAKAQQSSNPMAPNAKPRRMFCVMTNLGLIPREFVPPTAGRDYKPSPYMEVLQEHRNEFTVFSGTSLPNVGGSHPTQDAFLTGAPNPGSSSFKNTISLDQVVAEAIGVQTRFPSLALSVNGNSLSWTGSGVRIPAEQSPSEVFKQLFVQGSQKEVDAQVLKLSTGQSILDTIAGQVKDLERDLGTPDRERIDQFFTSVRDLESRLKVSEGWEKKPKPVVKAPAPVDVTSPTQFIEKIKVMYDLARLVFETDSSRAITLFCDAAATGVVDSPVGTAITEGYHGLSHHGKSEEKLAQIKALEVGQLKKFNELMAGLKATKENEESLLDRTMLLLGSNLSDGNSHVTLNLPIILAGGGFKHGQHLQFDNVRNYPTTNLYLSMLHRIGINRDKFSSSSGTMRGLEMT